jgi:hypothetical protein
MFDRIKESDWKIFRGLHQTALDRYCDRVLSEIKYVSTDTDATSHERYLQIYKLIHERDEKLGHLFDGKSRSKALFMLAGLREHRLVTDEEFARFSQELREAVEQILRIG